MDLRARLSAALGSRYTIEEELGRGGMAIVFQAVDHKHDRRVAVKVFRPELSAALGTDRFLQEIQITARLQHPHIVPLHDSGSADGLLYYIMPLVEGESLRARLDREKQLPLDEALGIARDVADALSHAHSHGVVHRDIKPENILLSGDHALVADFGVAGAISAARRGRLTQPGLAVGTPSYMSPEQAGGRDDLDGRSDIYSLGCVLYEMLSGQAPFTGPTPDALAARRLAEEPPSLHTVRASVPTELERVIGRTLARTPADRYRTAADLLEALRVASRGTDAVPARRRLPLGVAAGGVVLAGAALFLLVERSATSVPLDESLYVVFPFAHRAGAAPALVDGDQCELEVSNILRGFEDARTVEHFLVEDAIRRRGGGTLETDEALAVARGFGGRWLIRGEVAAAGDSTLVRATLFDARGGTLRGQASIGLPNDGAKASAAFRRLVSDLLGLTASVAADVSARSLAANQAFVEGRRSLGAGDLSGAALAFARAVRLDTTFALGYLWLAQVQAWQGAEADGWRVAAERAHDQLPVARTRDRGLSEALLALGDGRFQDACAVYRRLVAADSTDWTAWAGLGECQARDTVVVREASSPSNWAFRGSRHAGIEAYRRALRLTPFLTALLYERLVAVVPSEISEVRRGVAAPPDSGVFLAYPGFRADTFAFVPYPVRAIQRGEADEPTAGEAVARGRSLLRDLVSQWAAAYPGSADAREKLALTLERFGHLGDAAGGATALDAIREARRLADSTGSAALRYAVSEVRLELKLGHTARARALADSLLAIHAPARDSTLAEPMAALAALTGRAGLAAAALAANAVAVRERFPNPELRALPLPVVEARERLRAWAALGAPADSIRWWLAETERRLAAATGTRGRGAARAALLINPLMWAFPVLGASDLHRPDADPYLLGMQALAARGARDRLRARFDTLALLRGDVPPGAVAPGPHLQETFLLLAIGDTAAALTGLDASLGALPMSSVHLLDDVVDAAAVVRAMALRARLALAAGDTVAARRWAAPVAVLWASADPPLRRSVEDVLALAASAPAQR